MKLRDFYEREVSRDIQGVIKVDSTEYQKQELEEYVVTKELNKHFTNFYDSFTRSLDFPTEKMGVWISGFFGSGKSHFLKILSYLLENRDIDMKDGTTKKAVDFFDDKIEDKKLLADIKRVGTFNNDCILFNIDTKSESNKDKDKILQVFEKVLNEKMGLSVIPHIAELERYLIKKGKYDEFKDNFKKISGSHWKELRAEYLFNRDEIVEAYSKTLGKTKEEAENWLDTAKDDYSVSIESFAERVLDYVKGKDKNYHLIFLVDEIGQYIGDDRSLMLNLQSVVEELGVRCQGKAWVIVTSQEAIDDVVKIKGDDFSKIQGRFDTRLSMSSSDIREVIEKRILEKKKEATDSLTVEYNKKGDIIKNLLYVKNESSIKLYTNEIDFAKDYPFIPYQYELLQSVFEGIRKKGYAGKHLSSGERSLLGAFKQVAEKNGDKELGYIVPFYEFFDTIEKFLEHQITIVFNKAEDLVKSNKLDENDIKVLKVLFLLKNIDNIQANIENITTFLVDNVSNDKTVLRANVEKSLKNLERETFIQRTNDTYSFLTDDEQEINREIKRITITDQNKIVFFRDEIFGSLYPDNKYMYDKLTKPFPIKKSIDDVSYTNDYDIGINFITTYSGKKTEDIVRDSAMHPNMMYVSVPISNRIDDDINNALQIDMFREEKKNTIKSENLDIILKTKEKESSSVKRNIREIFTDTLSSVDIYIAGDKQNVEGNTFRARLESGFENLIANVYMKLKYIENFHTNADVKDLFYDKKKKIYGNTFVPNKLAYNEIKEFIDNNTTSGLQITVRRILQVFGSVPYGFSDDDILYLLVALLKNEQISLYFSDENLSKDDDDTLNKLIKRDFYDRTTLKTRKKIDQNLVEDLKMVARKAFNYTSLPSEEDDMIRDFRDNCLRKCRDELEKISYNYNSNEKYNYPGEKVVKEAKDILKDLNNIIETNVLFDEISKNKDNIISSLEKIQEVKDFFGENNEGKQKEIFDNAKKTIKIYENNSDYIKDDDELSNTYNLIINIITSEEPYFDLPNLNCLNKDLVTNLGKKYDEISAPAISEIQDNIKFIEDYAKENSVDSSIKEKYITILNHAVETLEKSQECKDIYAEKQLAEDSIKNFLLEAKKKKEPTTKEDTIKRKVVRIDAIVDRQVNIDKNEDIDKFVEDIKGKLYKELKNNGSILIK